MERYLLAGTTFFYLLGFAHSLLLLGAGKFRPGRFNLSAIAGGFVLQTVFLYLRGHAVGRCPITNTFEILVFLSWSIALSYLVVGTTYRISLLGVFTAPLVFALQLAALLLPSAPPAVRRAPTDVWLELHASTSLVAYGVLALACVAGVMFLVQEKQLKMRVPGSLFHLLPPITTLAEAMRRLLWFGVVLLSIGIVAGFFIGTPIGRVKSGASVLVWLAYAGLLFLWTRNLLHSHRVAQCCVGAFAFALVTLPAMYALGGLLAK
jgi:HemX protein